MWTMKQEEQHRIPSLGRCCLSLIPEAGDCFDMETFYHNSNKFISYSERNYTIFWSCNTMRPVTSLSRLALCHGLARTGCPICCVVLT